MWTLRTHTLIPLPKKRYIKLQVQKFGELQGYIVVIIRALYGLRTSRAAWHENSTNNLCRHNVKPSHSDADVWIWTATKQTKITYFEDIFIFVDGIIVPYHQAFKKTSLRLYRLKDYKVGQPKTDLGSKSIPLGICKGPLGNKFWAIHQEIFLEHWDWAKDDMKLYRMKWATTQTSTS